MKETTVQDEVELRKASKSNYYYYMPKKDFELIKSNRQKEKHFNLVYGFMLVFGGKYIPKNIENGVKALLKGAKSKDENSINVLKSIIESGEITTKLLEKEKEWVLSQ